MGIKSRFRGGAAAAYLRRLSRAQRIARAEFGCTAVAPIILMPVTREMTRRLVRALRRAKKRGETFRGILAGREVSVINSGVGAPSAEGKVVACLGVGAKVFLRVDICGALDVEMKVGDIVVAERAAAFDGTSRLVAAGEDVAASPRVLAAAGEAVRTFDGRRRFHVVTVATVDTFHNQTDEMHRVWRGRAAAVDMETSIIYHLARRAGAHALAIMAVSDVRAAGLDPFDAESFPYEELLQGLDDLSRFTVDVVRTLPASLTAAY